MTDATDPLPWRYATLDEARALECNRCGDCCDCSRMKPPVRFGWKLPENLFAEFNDGEPLIIPIEVRESAAAKVVPWEEGVAHQYWCDALMSEPDGTAICTLYGQPRPPPCGGFPVFEDDDGGDTRGATLWRRGALDVPTSNMPNCTWYAMLLLPAESPVLQWRRDDWTLDWGGLDDGRRDAVCALHDAARGKDEGDDEVES